MLTRAGRQTGQMVGRPEVVIVEEHDPIAMGEADACIARGRQTLVLRVAPENDLLAALVGEVRHEFLGAVVGAVLDEDEFPMRERLRPHGSERCAQITLGVVSGDADAEQRRVHKMGQGLNRAAVRPG